MSYPDRSEYEGGGVMPNTVFPKGTKALTASDKLRLQSITGQETDSRATPDPGFWQGNEYFDVNARPEPTQEQKARRQQNRRTEASRYNETNRPKSY